MKNDKMKESNKKRKGNKIKIKSPLIYLIATLEWLS